MLKTATLLIPQRIVHWVANRLFSKQQSTPVKTWSLPVQPFWQLSADVKNCNIIVESLSPVKNVQGDKMEVHLHSSSTDAIGGFGFIAQSLNFICFLHYVYNFPNHGVLFDVLSKLEMMFPNYVNLM